MDAYWAKDIHELFRVERRHSFQKFTELLFAQSGGPSRYPRGDTFVVAQDVTHAFRRKYADVDVRFVGLRDIVKTVTESTHAPSTH